MRRYRVILARNLYVSAFKRGCKADDAARDRYSLRPAFVLLRYDMYIPSRAFAAGRK